MARATAALNHPNILTVFDVGTHTAKPFLACELLEGQTLRERCLTSGWGKRDWVEHDPDLDPIRDDPPFPALLAQLRQ
jgi:hypothetical protein